MSKLGDWEKIQKVKETQELLDRVRAELQSNPAPLISGATASLIKAKPVYRNLGLGLYGVFLFIWGFTGLCGFYRPISNEKLLAFLLIFSGIAFLLLHLSLTPAVSAASTSGDTPDDTENSE